MKVISYNITSPIDLLKGKQVKSWLIMKGAFDAIVLIEIKCKGEDILQRLSFIDGQLKWVYTFHPQRARERA